MNRVNNVLITGAAGFLGATIVAQAVASGLSVSATDRVGSAKFSGVSFASADILDLNSLSKIFEGVDCVCHVAGLAHIFSPDAHSGEKFRQINEIGTANVASAASAAGVGHFILISSVSVYGTNAQGIYDEKTPCNPVGAYALSKYNAELRAIAIAQKSAMALTILRLATLYGEGDPGNVGRLMFALDKGRFLWVGNGSNRKSLLYKGDAARAVMAVIQRPASGVNIFNISAPPCTMREIVDGISNSLGKHPFPLHVPAPLAMLLSRYLSKILNRRISGLHQTLKKWLAEDVYDPRRFQEAYGFQTKTSLEVGLKREVDWYRQNKQNGQVVK